ncbi:hypothetical protein PFISCL1PPCAC_20111, partial [Pristionchus fissidentatus]
NMRIQFTSQGLTKIVPLLILADQFSFLNAFEKMKGALKSLIENLRRVEMNAIESLDIICRIARTYEYLIALFERFILIECLDKTLSIDRSEISQELSQIIENRRIQLTSTIDTRRKVTFFFSFNRKIVVSLFNDFHPISIHSLIEYIQSTNGSNLRQKFDCSRELRSNRIKFHLSYPLNIEVDRNPHFVSSPMLLVYYNTHRCNPLYFWDSICTNGFALGVVVSGSEFVAGPNMSLMLATLN